MRDNLPTICKVNESVVINLDSIHGPGTHWVCYVKRGNLIVYFDSFGNLPPPPELIMYFKNKPILYNSEQYQQPNTIICGHLCLLFLSLYTANYK